MSRFAAAVLLGALACIGQGGCQAPGEEDPYVEILSGHIDVTLNGQDAVMSQDTEFDIPDVEDGEWQLKVELSKADHTPLEPYAGDFIYVNVSADACD